MTPYRELLTAIALAAAFGATSPAARQAATETELKTAFLLNRERYTAPELKAAFLLNFARYTTWPATILPRGADLSICVSGDNRVADTLIDLARRRHVRDRAVTVRHIKNDGPDGCHLLFWSGSRTAERQALLQAAAGRPVLTVGDAPDFARDGGIINFFVEDQRMRFAINPGAAERAGLRVSSRLLNLAVIVKDVSLGL